MKTITAILLTSLLLLVSCTKWFTDDEGNPYVPPEVTEFGANSVGFAAGISAAQLPQWVDASLRNIYTLAMDGELDVPALNQLISTFRSSDDIVVQAVANRVITLAQLMGAMMRDGQIVHIDELDPKLMDAMGRGYIDGYNLAKKSIEEKEFMK